MKRILVGTDFGSAAAKAQLRGIRLAAAYGAAVRIVHAAADASPEQVSALQRRLESDATTIAEEIGDRQPDISTCVSAQWSAEAILHEAEAFDADLIVIGAHGVPRFRDVLFGTTGTHVVRHGTRPVLIVANNPFIPYARVMIAVSDPARADAIFGSAVALSPDAEMVAVHGFDPPVRDALAGAERLEREKSRIRTEMERRLATVRRQQAGGRASVGGRALVEDGDALTILMENAEAFEPNLIAMGTRRGTAYLGSHAVDTMFWATADLLIVPEREPALA